MTEETLPDICFAALEKWRAGERMTETELHLASQAAAYLKAKEENEQPQKDKP